ncbi:MAG: NrfD/PsrC family molybdoenzyme membrane anchor subunit [Verrucomicrobiota bacterium]
MTAPFGLQIVFYLFLAGVAAGSALVAGFSLSNSRDAEFHTSQHPGKRALIIALTAMTLGIVFLIADLAKPSEFFLILTKANPLSAIAWGARIVTSFFLVTLLCWALFRGKATGDNTFLETSALWLLRFLALALAIYPGFVLLQGDANQLWQSWIIIPLIAISGIHAGFAACNLWRSQRRRGLPGPVIERGLTILLLFLTILFLILQEVSPLGLAGVFLLTGVLLPLFLSGKAAVLTSLSVLTGSFILRAWLIQEGQALF